MKGSWGDAVGQSIEATGRKGESTAASKMQEGSLRAKEEG